jgi:DNA-3-methyladenine glycosylase I
VTDWAEVGVVRGADGRRRCGWCVSAPENLAYHDDEWGRPVTDEARTYEKICLEGFQSGLSWLTILRKRDAFRQVFAGFQPEAVARFGPADVDRLVADPRIVRHRGKIEAAVANARAVVRLHEDRASLAALLWSFEPRRRGRPVPTRLRDLPGATDESTALSKALSKRGFRYVGPTTVYAAMQALGIVNDHLRGCHARADCERERRLLATP